MNDRLFIALQHLAPQHLLTHAAGWLANCTWAPLRVPFVQWFVRRYQVDMSEACVSDPLQYRTFNDFFTRALKDGARSLAGDDDTLACPADGAISQLGPITGDTLLQAKGRDFSLTSLLGGDATLAEQYRDGSFVTVYLSPRDYHRVHMPLAGTLTRMIHVPGKLFSVNQVTARHVDSLFARNERVVCCFDTAQGPMALVLVGAMIVGSVDTVWAGQVCPGRTRSSDIDYRDHVPPVQISRGDEMGRFKLGSTVIAVFGPGMASLAASLGAGDAVRMGQAIGTVTQNQSRYEQQ